MSRNRARLIFRTSTFDVRNKASFDWPYAGHGIFHKIDVRNKDRDVQNMGNDVWNMDSDVRKISVMFRIRPVFTVHILDINF